LSPVGGLHWSTGTDNAPPSWNGRTDLLSANDRGGQLITNLIKDKRERRRKRRRRRKGDAGDREREVEK